MQAEEQKAHDTSAENEDSVEHARMMAAKMNAQMQQGVEEAEKLHHQRALALKKAKKNGKGLSQMLSHMFH